ANARGSALLAPDLADRPLLPAARLPAEGRRDAALARPRSRRRNGQRRLLRKERAAEAARPGRRSAPTRTRDAGSRGAARGGADLENSRRRAAGTAPQQHLTASARTADDWTKASRPSSRAARWNGPASAVPGRVGGSAPWRRERHWRWRLGAAAGKG